MLNNDFGNDIAKFVDSDSKTYNNLKIAIKDVEKELKAATILLYCAINVSDKEELINDLIYKRDLLKAKCKALYGIATNGLPTDGAIDAYINEYCNDKGEE